MALAKERSLSVVLIIALVLSMFLPSFTFAQEEPVEPNRGSLTIYKLKQEPVKGEENGGEHNLYSTGLPGQDAQGEPVEGVTYELTQTHKYDPITDEWTEFAGEPFTRVTDENGEIHIPNIDLGRYSVQEIDGPSDIIINEEIFHIDIPMTNEDGTELIWDVHIYPKNEIIRGDTELEKVDEDGEPIQGVVFGLYKENGEEIDQLTTDANGIISVEGLKQGRYYFQEKETVEGLAINTSKIWFEVVAGEQNKVEWTPITGFVDGNGRVINYQKPEIEKDVEGGNHHSVDRDKEYKYNITITTPGDIEKYKALGAWDTLDSRLSFITNGSIEGGWEVTGTTKDNIIFTENGQTLNWDVKDLTKLTPGTDIVITFTAKINPDAELNEGETGIPNQAEIEFDNDKGQSNDPNDDPEEPPTPPVTVDPSEGGLKIIKVDKKDNTILLPGAEFKLTDIEGNTINAAGTTIKVNGQKYDGLLENLVTDNNGEIRIEGLTPGDYLLHETKAPTYIDEDGVEKPYRLLTKPLEIKVVEGSTDDNAITVENSKSGWDLPTTGGIGTILFTAVGLALMGAAMFLLFRRKKEQEA